AATILAAGPCRVAPVARLLDVETAMDILRRLGAKVEWRAGGLDIDTSDAKPHPIGPDLTGRMRASVLFLGPLLARFGVARAHLPGGCKLGERPIDYHLQGFEALGATCGIVGDEVRLRLPSGSKGSRRTVTLAGVSVGATENVLMAACGVAAGATMKNVAREPEIQALAAALRAFGMKVSGEGGSILEAGPGRARGAKVRVPPDRIVAGTLAAAILASGGEGRVAPYPHADLEAFTAFLRGAGAIAEEDGEGLIVARPRRLAAVSLSTGPFPAFPTDLQPPASALLCTARGLSRVTETVFERRHLHLDRLRRMGACIEREGRRFIISGVGRLVGARVSSTDLRCAAALVVAALGAKGESVIADDGHLERGYVGLEGILRGMGARMEIV
ncbi:UDP-N-acetylglucosamine 1-carboxyvinyltransferase, partial [bacterium]|nr:UDP-N-acetylglucosamine 1-carboxyvinyltransferase [bacterium]